MTSLEMILAELSQQQKSFERDIFIQGTFLRVVINWENFIEEVFLAAMCSCITLSNTQLKPKAARSRNKEEAFRKLNAKRRLRDSEYIDWIDYTKLKQRIVDQFHHASRFHQVYRDAGILNQIKSIRNHIAHNSKQTERKFKEQIIQNAGYLATPDANAADILVAVHRRSQQRFFELYTNYYIETANIICK